MSVYKIHQLLRQRSHEEHRTRDIIAMTDVLQCFTAFEVSVNCIVFKAITLDTAIFCRVDSHYK